MVNLLMQLNTIVKKPKPLLIRILKLTSNILVSTTLNYLPLVKVNADVPKFIKPSVSIRDL